MAFKPVGIDENSLFPPRVETRLSTTFATTKDAQSLDRLTQSASVDRQASQASNRVSYEDAPSFIESWADLTAWSSGTFAQVSAARLYSSGTPSGSDGANHAFALAATDTMRAVFNVRTIGAGTSGGLMVGVTSDSAGGAFTGGGATLRGLYFTGTNIVTMTDGASGAGMTPGFGASGAVTDWQVTLTVDAEYITATAINLTTPAEYRARWLRTGYTVNNLAVFNSDSRNLTGHSVGKTGARKNTVTIVPRAGLEDQAATHNWTAIGNSSFRVVLPKGYDSRKPAPVVMLFHGNASDELTFASSANHIAVSNAFVEAGYIAVSAAYKPAASTWGATLGLDAYYAAYKYVRDRYSIGPVVLYGNSMGGAESLLTLAQRRIPAVAWLGSVPVTNLATSYANATFTATIESAYGIASGGADYAAKTAGHDPNLMSGAAFRGLPMWVLIATGDTDVPPAQNFDLFGATVSPYAAELVRIDAAGGHSASAIATNAPAMVAFANKYVAG